MTKYLDTDGVQTLVRLTKKAIAGKQDKGNYAILVDGKIPTTMIAGAQSSVMEFDGILTDTVEVLSVGITDTPSKIFYYEPSHLFIAAFDNSSGGLSSQTPTYTYYNVWPTSTSYNNEEDADNEYPLSDVIFVDTTTNKSYRWSGSQLTEIVSTIALGETAETAYPGDKGKALADGFEEVKTLVDTIKGGVSTEQSAREEADTNLQSAIDTLKSDTTTAISDEAAAREAAVKEITDSIGEAGGIAPLDEDGKISKDLIPDDVGRQQVLSFQGTVAGVTAQTASISSFSYIVYDTTVKRFYAVVSGSGMSLSGSNATYYNNWATRANYQNETTNTPYTNTLYIDTQNATLYAWGGTDMINLSGAKMVTLTQDEYDAMAAAGTLDDNTYYNILEE